MNQTINLGTLFLMLVTLGSSGAVQAADREKEAPKDSGDAAASFRCEKMRDGTLTKLKEKLVTNCDLNRPFSFSSAETLEVTYTYCCSKK